MLDPSRGQNRLIAEGPCRATQPGGSATASAACLEELLAPFRDVRDIAVQTQATFHVGDHEESWLIGPSLHRVGLAVWIAMAVALAILLWVAPCHLQPLSPEPSYNADSLQCRY